MAKKMIFTIDNTNDSKKWTQNEQDSQSKQNWLDHGKIQISGSPSVIVQPALELMFGNPDTCNQGGLSD
jgi:hypothetical protein